MHKKKNQSKINLPSVGMKPTQTSKNYSSKNSIPKCRQIDDRNIYFEMPSIHQNDLSLKTFMEGQQRSLHKIQVKILKYFQSLKENKMLEEWDLYIKKSQIINTRNIEFSELQEFLVRTVYKVINKFNELNQSTSFSFNKSTNRTTYECQIKDPIDNKTLLQDRILLSQESKLNNKSVKVDEQIDPINLLTQQNVILQKKNQIYEKRIQQLSIALAKYQEKQNDSSGGQKDTTNELIQTITAKNKFKYQCQVKSMHIQSLTRQLNLTRQQFNIVKLKFQEVACKARGLAQENSKLKDYLKYKQLWQMATEQVISWRQISQEEKQEKERGYSKIKLLKDKNKQLLNYFNMSNVVNPDQEEDKQDLDKIIKEFKEWLMIISVPKVANHSINQQKQPQERLTNLQEVNVKLLRPNFYIFFEAFQNTLLMEKNIINIRPIQYNFFLKIRVIFDSIFKQFLISNSYKDYPSFPQYVIGFLQKYQVNAETGKMEYRKKPIENEQKITFLVNLFNKNFCNTWQCEIFKSFLFENYYLDEIYFFLQCRNQFNGGVHSTNVLGSVDPISYVKLSKALKVVAKQLAPYENYIIEKVKNILKNKKKIKYGQSFVDKHFVLKLLLQVYSLQRAKSQRIFESSFKLKMKKSYITFGDFHHFMTKNFAFITSTQVAQLYRQVYTLSSGHVTHRTIHYICGSKGLFIPLLLQKRINKLGIEKSLSGDMLLLDIQNVVTKTTTQLQDFGEESFMNFQYSVNNFMRQLDYYKSNKSLFYQRIYQQKCKVLRMNTLIELASSYQLNLGETLEESQIQTRMIQLHSLLHQTDTQVHLLSRQKQKRNKAWKMLVRNFKIRIQESILQFQKVNQEQIKKLRQQMQRTNINKQQQLEQQLKKEKVSQGKING